MHRHVQQSYCVISYFTMGSAFAISAGVYPSQLNEQEQRTINY